MEEKIVSQLRKALSILENYPGINDILNIEGVKSFLNRLERVDSIVDIPDFSPVSQDKLDLIVKGLEGTREEWVSALNKLRFVMVFDDDNEDNVVIDTRFPVNLSEAENPEDKNGYATFLSDNKAKFGSYIEGLKDATGTWAEIYFKLVEHVNQRLSYPDLPESDSLPES